MTYLTQARLSDDATIRIRVTACAASENIPDPEGFAYRNRWAFSAQPGWVEAYTGNPETEGAAAGAEAITDEMILTAVRTITT